MSPPLESCVCNVRVRVAPEAAWSTAGAQEWKRDVHCHPRPDSPGSGTLIRDALQEALGLPVAGWSHDASGDGMPLPLPGRMFVRRDIPDAETRRRMA